MEDCQHGHSAPKATLGRLLDSQAGLGRHRCVVCAYAAGVNADQADLPGPKIECQHGQEAPRSTLEGLPFSQAGSGRHKCVVCAYAMGQQASTGMFPDEIVDEPDLTEGAKRQVTVNAYERNPLARERCIAHYGSTCQVCGFDFATCYGELGAGFIHVHHRRALSDLGSEYVVDPVDDLIPVCPNCHAMLHRRKPALEPDWLRGLVEEESD